MAPGSHVDRSKTNDLPQHSTERWNAAGGYLVIVLGVAGAAFERGSYSLPLALLLLGTTVASRLLPLALIWVVHISVNGFLGFGLQYPTGAGGRHLGRLGRRRPIGQAA